MTKRIIGVDFPNPIRRCVGARLSPTVRARVKARPGPPAPPSIVAMLWLLLPRNYRVLHGNGHLFLDVSTACLHGLHQRAIPAFIGILHRGLCLGTLHNLSAFSKTWTALALVNWTKHFPQIYL